MTVSGALTFTAADWDRAQTVTVSAAQDADAADDAATVSHAVSGGGYGSVTAAEVAVTVADDETASTGVTLTVSDEAVDEDAGATAITVTGALNGAPGTSDTAVTVSVSGGTASTEDFAAVADFTLTIDAGETSGTASFTLMPVDDAIDEDDETGARRRRGAGVWSVTPEHRLTIEDDDARGIAVSPTALQVPEGGAATYTVALRSQPTGPVTVSPSVAGSPDVTLSPAALTFGTENWATAQTLTVSATGDADAEDETAVVSHDVAGGDYDAVSASNVAVTVEDDETASTGVTLMINPEFVDEAAGATPVTVTAALDGTPRTADTALTLSVSPGTASDADFAAVQDFTLTIDAGETSGTARFTLTPVDDAIDENDETVRVTGIAKGLKVMPAMLSIMNTDPMHKAWIARFGRTAAGHVLEGVESRIMAPRTPGLEVQLAGHRIGNAATPPYGIVPLNDARLVAGRDLSGWHQHEGDVAHQSDIRWRTVTERDLLTGSSFALTKGTKEGDLISLWGRGAITRFQGLEDNVSLDGEVASGMLGADWTRGNVISGLILSHSRGEGGYRRASYSGSVSSTLTGLYPWGRYALGKRLSVWGTAGYGRGALTLTPTGQASIRTDLDLMMIAAGLRGVLVQEPETGGLTLALKTDGLLMRTSTTKTPVLAAAAADVTRLRLGLEGSLPFSFGSGATLIPSVEIGVRHDKGDAETGMGMEAGGGLRYVDPRLGLTVETRVRALLTHEDGAYEEWGLGGSVQVDPGQLGRGLALRLDSSLGVTDSGTEVLLQRQSAAGLAPQHERAARGRIGVEMGYGLDVPWINGILTPYSSVELAGASRSLRLGWRFELGQVLNLSLDGERHETPHAPPEYGFMLRTRLPW